MDKITRQAINKLLQQKDSAPAITIYCPMHKAAAPPQLTEAQIRFKNLIHKAVEQLKYRSNSQVTEKVLCKTLEELQADQTFWESQSQSLLLCARGDKLKMFHLPIATEEYVAVDDTFHLAPVLSMLQQEAAFYVLTLSRHEPKLFKGDLYGLHDTNVVMPRNIQESLNLDEVNHKSEHQRSATGPSMGTAGFQGRGGARDPAAEDQARFFRMIDHIVCTNTDRTVPLILAGIDAETAQFRGLSKYPNIINKSIRGSFRDAKPSDIANQAFELVHDEIVKSNRQNILNEYETIKGANPKRIAIKKDAIVSAAEQGKIDKLLIRMLRTTNDNLIDTKQAINRITFPDIDLSATINKMAARVWQTSGKVIGMEASEMPDGAPMVAHLRY